MGVLMRFLACVIAMPVSAWLLPGVHAASNEAALLAGLLLGVVYLVVRPLVKLIVSPFNCLTFGIIGFVVDVLFVQFFAGRMAGFTVDSFWWAAAASIVVSVLREVMGKLGGRKR